MICLAFKEDGCEGFEREIVEIMGQSIRSKKMITYFLSKRVIREFG